VSNVINTNEIAEEYRLGYWAQILQARADSGLTIRAYCEQQGFPENRFFYWQRKLRAAVSAEVCSAPDSNPHPGWTELVQDTKTLSEPCQVTVEVGKYRIVVSHDTDTNLLVKICKALASAC